MKEAIALATDALNADGDTYCPACWNALGIKRDHRTSYPTRCPVSGNRPMR